jgi:glutamate dehydrogenase (NADP+)
VDRRFTGSGAQVSDRLEEFMAGVVERNPGEEEFHQAVREVFADVIDDAYEDERTRRAGILERMTEPDRTVIFRVTWETDEGTLRANRAYRVQFNNSIGPYKGGLRFVDGLKLATLKFLGFEQTFKNALTGLPMGGAKGGSDFSPKGKSDAEVMRFCQSMMLELHRHIGEDVDVPAGDIGVGAREIAFLFGQYKRLENRFAGVLTGKGLSFGGSAGRSEATGYGVGLFTALMLERDDDGLDGKRCAVSGSGNVSIFCAEKLADLGAVVISLSDSDGTVYDPDGMDAKKLEFVKELKLGRRGRIAEYAENFGCEYLEGETPWGLDCDLAFPCATQNELGADDVRSLIESGCTAIVEGANMPLTIEALQIAREEGVAVGPAKAANAGGVAVSGLEQSQNAVRVSWSRETVERQLHEIMERIHGECAAHGQVDDDRIDYVRGANRAGFERVREAMLAYGAV